MKTIHFFFILMLMSQIGLAQVPSLSIQRDSGKESLEISELAIDVEIVGNTATTTFDIVFYNPFNKILEGELSMPLKNGQEICRYALDVNGKLREGVIVEKVKARQTYEAVVRRGIDPGIINKTKGNNFKTKIYPVPAKGSKRVVLALIETLVREADDLQYSLPLEGMPEVKQFSLDVKAIKSSVQQEQISSSFQNIEFDHQNDAEVFHFEREDFSSKDPLNFTIPFASKAPYQLFTYELDGETYFYLNMKPDELASRKKKAPEHIAIFWDNSFSASQRNTAQELQLLEAYINSFKKEMTISVTLFNQSASEPKLFGSADAVIRYIQHAENDGASLFEDLILPEAADEVLIFSDGVNTIGKDELPLTQVPIYAITSSAGSNSAFLNRICTKTNGALIDLNRVSNDWALQRLTHDEEKFLSYDYRPGSIREIYPNVPTRVDGYFEVAGILMGDETELKLNFGGNRSVSQTQSYRISKTTGSATIARLWATKKIAALSIDEAQNNEEIILLSQKHNIITKNTSLLVLDRVEDYVAYKITPPTELLDEYNRLLTLQKNREPKVSSHEQITSKNITRMKALTAWYVSPPNISTTTKVGERAMTGSVAGIEIEEEEIIPLLRASGDVPPPPPSLDEVVMVAYGADDGMVIEAENDDEVLSEAMMMAGTPSSQAKSSIKVLSWLPDAPYLQSLKDAEDKELLPLYYTLKDEHRHRPSFYIEVSDLLFTKGRTNDAIRILSNTVELDLENPELLKVVARRLLDEGAYDLAIKIYLEIKALRPEEPQSFRDLAMAYRENKAYNQALDMYLYILDHEWGRFEEMKDVVLNELNALVALHKDSLDLSKVNKSYIKAMPLDVRITIDWSSNENDIDLWVVDPNGEKCFYSHSRTALGGKITKDFTRGYGPEEFSLKSAKRGFYTVYVNYFSESRQTITGPVTVYAEMATHYGTKNQETRRLAIQLENDGNKKTMQIGQLEFMGE